MAPKLEVASELLPILIELQALEPLFHGAYKHATPAQFEALVAPDFWEVGATGRQYSRDFALQVLTQRQTTPDGNAWQAKDYHLQALNENTYLLTYSLQQADRATRRLTVWQRKRQQWQAIYHQGTVIENPEKIQVTHN
ncbi:MAG: DUF4440 domain-containing protein [Methylophilaceae bacterium]